MGIATVGLGFVGLLFGLVISFVPTLIAFLRNNIYKKQVLIYQFIMLVAGFVASLVISLLARLSHLKLFLCSDCNTFCNTSQDK